MNPDSKKLLRTIVNCVSVMLSIIAIICIPYSGYKVMTWAVWLQVANIMVLMSVRYYTNPNR